MASKEFDACVNVACSGTKDYLEAMMDKRVSVIVLAEIDETTDGCMSVMVIRWNAYTWLWNLSLHCSLSSRKRTCGAF